MPTQPSRELQTFDNPASGRDYEVHFECPEFTCVCPMTGQPDFATFAIRYVPDRLCVELKSLKLYLWSFREEGHFHEAVANRVLDDLVALLQPRSMTVEARFLPRGGITTTVTASYGKDSHDARVATDGTAKAHPANDETAQNAGKVR